MHESLEHRRPKFLRQMVGNGAVLGRIRAQMLSGRVLRRALIYGPTGSGKTTLAHILARHAKCLARRPGQSDICGECDGCRLDLGLDTHFDYQEWTGADLEEQWKWFERNGDSVLDHPSKVFFLDEAQDLSQPHQKAFLRKLEKAQAVVIFATTHRGTINDALEGRFGVNVYELRWPDREEVADHLLELAQQRGVKATRAHVVRVADHYACNLRKCVDFVYTAESQCPDRRVTDAFLDTVTGPGRGEPEDGKGGSHTRSKL